jgi:ribulose kinase
VPLALLPAFADNPNAQAWLWKDHTSHAEADEITALAAKMRPQYLAKCGGLAVKSPLLMQIYADILGMPMALAASDQTCALGAALFGAVAADAF